MPSNCTNNITKQQFKPEQITAWQSNEIRDAIVNQDTRELRICSMAIYVILVGQR